MYSQKLSYFLFAFIFILQSNVCLGQSNFDRPLVFNNIGTDQGLAHNFVNATVQDDHGFIWIGTNDGLCRFDSHDKFKIYRDKDENIPNGLQSSLISVLHISAKNTLYIGTRQGGLSVYDIENDIWATYMHDENNPNSISNDEVLSIVEDTKGRVWIGTENGLNLFDKEKRTFKNYLAQPTIEGKLKAKAILSIAEDNNGWIWVGTWDGGMYLLDIDPITSDVFFRHFNPEGDRKRNCIWSIYQDEYDNYWLGSHTEGLYLMSVPDDAKAHDRSWQPSFQKYWHEIGDDQTIPSNYLTDITKDGDGNIWIACVKGISIVPKELISQKFDLRNKPELVFNKNIYDSTIKTSIPDNNVTNVYVDNTGVIWLATRAGSSRFGPLSNQIQDFGLFDINYVMPNSQSYYVDKNNVCWIAAGKDGLLHYDKQIKSYKQALESTLKDHNFVSSLYSKNGEKLYIISDKGIIEYDQKIRSMKEFSFELDSPIDVRRTHVVYTIQDDQSNLWMASENGLIQFNLITHQFNYFQNDPLDPSSIVDNSVTHILINSKNQMWISTYNGLSRLIQEGNNYRFKNYKASNVKGELKANKITSLIDLDSIMIIGTRSGILGYNYEKDLFLDYRDGNEKISVNSLIAVPNGEVWGVGLTSVFKFDTESKKFLSFDYKDGASSSQYLQNSAILSHDKILHFGNMRGFTQVDPITFKTNITPPNLSITEVEILNPDGRRQINMIHEDLLEINSDHYSIEFSFAALNYNRPEKMKYAYMLEGFDQEWKYLDKYVDPTYTNLDHGEYTFKIKAANEVGIWSEAKSLPVTVKPSFFETNLAKVLLLLLSGLVVFLLIKFYTKRIQSRNKELQNFNESLNKEIKQRELIENELKKTNLELTRSNEELEQFAYIASHDLQEPLRITGSFIDLLGERYADVLDENAFKFIDFAKGGVSRMGLLIKNLLTFSKVGGTVLNFQKASIHNIAEEKLLDLAGLIKDKNANIELGMLPEIICEKSQIAMLFYNLINNAIKFNNKPVPVVKISSPPSNDPDMHTFSISDNGIGIAHAHKDKIFEIFKRLHDKDEYDGTGIGLALCKKIVDRHRGTIWIDSTVGEGTTFNFTLAKDPTKYQDKDNIHVTMDQIPATTL